MRNEKREKKKEENDKTGDGYKEGGGSTIVEQGLSQLRRFLHAPAAHGQKSERAHEPKPSRLNRKSKPYTYSILNRKPKPYT